MGVALVLGFVVALIYMLTTERYTKNFAITLVILPLLVGIVLLSVNGNLGTSIAVLGTFGLIRFRSIPGTSKEISSIFFSMAIGVACAMGQIYYAILFTVVIAIVLVILSKTNFGVPKPTSRHLKVMIPEDLDYTNVFEDIFKKYTKSYALEQVKTVNLGSMYLLDYQLELSAPENEKKMIDELRMRNGNLSITCGIQADKNQEM
jgi:hypothetical protein